MGPSQKDPHEFYTSFGLLYTSVAIFGGEMAKTIKNINPSQENVTIFYGKFEGIFRIYAKNWSRGQILVEIRPRDVELWPFCFSDLIFLHKT